MRLKDLLTAVRTGWVVILVAAVVFAGAAALLGTRTTPSVTATSRLVFSTPVLVETDQDQTELVSMQLRTYADIATSDLVQLGAAEAAGIAPDGRSAHRVTATLVPGTRILQLEVTSGDAETAVALADSTVRELETVLQGLEGAGDRSVVEAATDARLVTLPVTPGPGRDIVLGAAAGAVMGLALVVALGALSRRRRLSADDLHGLRDEGVDVVDVVADRSAPDAAALVRSRLLAVPSGPAARVVLVVPTSSVDAPFADVLVSSLVAARYRVAQLDLRTVRPESSPAGIELDDSLALPAAVSADGGPAHLVLAFHGSEDVLVSPEMTRVLESLASAYQHVVVVTDSTQTSQTGAVVAHLVDQVLVTVTPGSTTPEQLREALESLGSPARGPVGVVGVLR